MLKVPAQQLLLKGTKVGRGYDDEDCVYNILAEPLLDEDSAWKDTWILPSFMVND